MTVQLRRSVLYLPASNGRTIEKARTLACDVVVLDLEDAVAPDAKVAAREAAVAAVAAGGFAAREVVVRVNALSTEWGEHDLRALARVTPAAVLLPKVDQPADVARAQNALGGGTPVWAMIETARSVLRLEAIAASTGLGGLVVGTNDLARELGARLVPDRAGFMPFLSMTVAAARAYGLAVLDGVYNALDDEEGLARQCRQAADLGFDGKTLIHPKQIGPCNVAFTPTADEVAWAQAVVQAFDLPENSAKGVIGLNGRMVERLHLEPARKALAMAEAADTDRAQTASS